MDTSMSETSLELEDFRCHLSVFGAGKVGKSKIVDQLLNKRYTEDYTPTVEDYYLYSHEFAGTTLTLEIVDTSGTEQFPAMRKLNIQHSKLVLLVYDVSDESSFFEVQRLYYIVREISECTIIIVGAKADFLPSDIPEESKNLCNIADLFASSERDQHLYHCLCSAKKSCNIDQLIKVGFTSTFPRLAEKLVQTPKHWRRFLRDHIANHYDDHHHGVWCIFKHWKNKFHKEC